MHKIGTFSPATGAAFDKGGGGIFHTLNGGITWEHTAPGELFDNNSVPRFVHFKDKNHGIAVGDPNDGYFEVYTTNNKGKKWKRVTSKNLPAPLLNEVGWISGHAVVGNTIWFGTSAGRMYKSTNFGKDWTVHTVDSIPGTYVNEIAFLDDGLQGVAHLRGRNRTFVFSTSDGGLTWTNYFQPANWKNSRMTAVPGTNAFVSTAVHGNPQFQGSAVSYDAGQTWTEIEKDASKAVCRFFDANTGYAGGFFITGPPLRGGIYKSQIAFQLSSATKSDHGTAKSNNQLKEILKDPLVRIYPTPAKNIVNVALPDAWVNTVSMIIIINMSGKVMEAKRSNSSGLIQVNTSQLTPGLYILRIASNGQTVNKTITVAR